MSQSHILHCVCVFYDILACHISYRYILYKVLDSIALYCFICFATYIIASNHISYIIKYRHYFCITSYHITLSYHIALNHPESYPIVSNRAASSDHKASRCRVVSSHQLTVVLIRPAKVFHFRMDVVGWTH